MLLLFMLLLLCRHIMCVEHAVDGTSELLDGSEQQIRGAIK